MVSSQKSKGVGSLQPHNQNTLCVACAAAEPVHPPFSCLVLQGGMHHAQVQALWKSCLPGSKRWQASKKAAYKVRHLLWIQGKI